MNSSHTKRMGRFIDLTDQKFGRLTVKYRGENRCGHPTWYCECECGGHKEILGEHLRGGFINSCGCLQKEICGSVHRTHGQSRTKYSHRPDGTDNTRPYLIWKNMRQRCGNPKNPNYDRYGGRGISVCDEWNDYIIFYEWAIQNGYSDKLTLERKDNDLGYDPSNCKWATHKEQMNNNSRSNMLTHNGRTQSITMWAEELNIKTQTIQGRIDGNLSEDKIFYPGSLAAKNGKGHGDKLDRLDARWSAIRGRCLNPKHRQYKNYGARGITICDEWLDKQVFKKWSLKNGYQPHLSLDRKDVDGPYSPDNCRWITPAEQNRNTRRNVFLTYNGTILCKADWAKKLQISPSTLNSRLKSEMPEERLFHTGSLKITLRESIK
jgi:hypothetical protein